MSQQGGVYFEQGTGVLVVPNGTSIRVEGGGAFVVGSTDFASVLASVPTADQEDGATVWLDNGQLKVSSTAG